MTIELLILPCIGWLVHRQEMLFREIVKLDKKLAVLDANIPKRSTDKHNHDFFVLDENHDV